MNTIKTFFLLSIMTVFFILIGKMIGGQSGMMIAFVFALVMNFVSYWYSDKIVLKIHKAKKVDKSSQIFQSFSNLLSQAKINGPKLYIYESEEPNAFATGRNFDNSVVAVSTSLVETLSADELEGVLAHEIAHIENNDILIASIAATFAGAISMIASMLKWGLIFGAFRGNRESGSAIGHLLVAILAPLIASVILAYLLDTVVVALSKYTKLPRILSLAIVFLVFLVLRFLFCNLV